MRILVLSALILISLNLKSQSIQVSDLDSAIATADRLIETNPQGFTASYSVPNQKHRIPAVGHCN
jgi:hypothetical protein